MQNEKKFIITFVPFFIYDQEREKEFDELVESLTPDELDAIIRDREVVDGGPFTYTEWKITIKVVMENMTLDRPGITDIHLPGSNFGVLCSGGNVSTETESPSRSYDEMSLIHSLPERIWQTLERWATDDLAGFTGLQQAAKLSKSLHNTGENDGIE